MAATWQAWTEELEDWRDFPIDCGCLAECHSLNYRLAYVQDCVNVSLRRLAPSTEKSSPDAYRDPFGDGKWMRQA